MPESDHHGQALAFLKKQLGDAAPSRISLQAQFDEHPLEQEGATSVFSFTASIGGASAAAYWVVAGKTEPNYFPAWGLTPEDVYNLHLGTRFMLVVGVSTLPIDRLSVGVGEQTADFIGSVVSGAAVRDLTAAAAFQVEDAVHAIFRAVINDESVYVLSGECPPAIYRDTQLPPHVVYRQHLGMLIRHEAKTDKDR